jgi:hypothetical protein
LQGPQQRRPLGLTSLLGTSLNSSEPTRSFRGPRRWFNGTYASSRLCGLDDAQPRLADFGLGNSGGQHGGSREHHHSFEPSPPRNLSTCGHNPPIGRKRIPAESKATPVGAIFVRPGPPGLGEMEMIASANPKKAIGCSSTECLEPDQSATSGLGRLC